MSKKIKFTADRVAGFKCEPGKQQTLYWDTYIPGHGLRVTESGAKAFIFEARLHGKTLRLTIGNSLTWTLGKSQAEATRLKTLVDQGIDPRQVAEEKKAEFERLRIEAKKKEVAVGEAWEHYLEERRPHWSERHYANHVKIAKPGGQKRLRGRRTGESDYTVPGPIFELLDLPLASLSVEVVKDWLSKQVERGPTQAEDVYRKLRAFLNWCEENKEYSGIVSSDVCLRREVRSIVPKVGSKDDCLQREQLESWFSAVRKINNPIISAYLQILLLTGSRRNELAPLKWIDVDFRWKSMIIGDKVEGERTIPLTPYVEHLLLDLKRRNEAIRVVGIDGVTRSDDSNPSPFVFSSKTSESGYIAEPRIAHKRALDQAGIDGLTLHGLRRSFGTLSEWVEVPIGVVAQLMGHKPSAIAEKHYRKRPIDLLRSWHEKIETWILEQANIEFARADQVEGLRSVK